VKADAHPKFPRAGNTNPGKSRQKPASLMTPWGSPFRDREHRGERRRMKAAVSSGQSLQPHRSVQYCVRWHVGITRNLKTEAGMSRKKRKRMQPGHFCWACGRWRANERFSGRGHARHLCRDSSELGADELACRQALRNLERCMTWEGIIPRKRRKSFE